MSFDYLNDISGSFRKKKKTKFTDIENRAISLLQSFYNQEINTTDFSEEMNIIDNEFHKLMFDDKTNTYVFDEDTPGWLNLFLGNKFRPWYRFHQIFNEAKKNRELTSSSQWSEVVNLERMENEKAFYGYQILYQRIQKTLMLFRLHIQIHKQRDDGLCPYWGQ